MPLGARCMKQQELDPVLSYDRLKVLYCLIQRLSDVT